MPRRVAGLQQRGSTGYARTTGQSIRLNAPDGWVANQNGPAWYIGGDQLDSGEVDWTQYGLPEDNPWPYNGGPIGRYREWGGKPFPRHLHGHGILSAVTRATAIIVGPVVRTSWRYYSGSPTQSLDVRKGIELENRPLWTVDPHLTGRIPGGEANRPTLPRARRLGPHDFWRTLLAHALWFGRGAMIYVEDADGQPLAGTLRILNPGHWGTTDDGRFVLDPDGEDPVESDFDGCFDMGPVKWCMRVLRGFAPNDGRTPEGALSRSGLLLRTSERMNSYLGSVLATGVPAGVLSVSTPNFDGDQATELKRRWMEAHGGVRKSVAVLNSSVDFKPLQFSVVDADLVNAKGALLADIAHAFGLSSSWLDANPPSGGSMTYANLVDRRRDLLDLCLADWGRSMEDFIGALLPFSTSMRVDWAGFLNIDPTNGLAFVESGLDKGFLDIEEARDRLGLPPTPITTEDPNDGADS